jgi:hypothetical protein
LKNKRVLTPQIYAQLLALACKNKAKSVDVVDIWAVPDYQAYFDGFINPNLGSYAKGKWSQLQIFFEAVDMCEKYPMGVKVSHRAYSCDRVKLLKALPSADKGGIHYNDEFKNLERQAQKDFSEGNFPGIIWDQDEVTDFDNSDQQEEKNGSDMHADAQRLNVGYKPIEMVVDTFENEHSILRCFPFGELKPQAFVEGAIEKIKKTAELVKRKFAKFDGVIRQWNEFLEIAPKSDDVYEYIRDHPLYVPFAKDLFQLELDQGYATTRDLATVKAFQEVKDSEAVAKKAGGDLEIWRSLPCMTKKSKIPFERVKSAMGDKGKKTILQMCQFIISHYFSQVKRR